MFCSCHTYEKLEVRGNVGTQILAPGEKYLGTIGSSGSLQLKISSDLYYAYLLSKSSQLDGTPVPFALDYKFDPRKGKKRLAKTLIILGTVGGFTFGTIGGLIKDSPGASVGILSLGGVLLAGMLPTGIAQAYKFDQLAWDYDFSYLGIQTTNENIDLIPCSNLFRSSLISQEQNVINSKASSTATPKDEKTNLGVEPSQKTFGDRSQKKISNPIQGVIGVHENVKGSLTDLKGNIVETYTQAQILITRIDQDNVNVNVNVRDDDGMEFFAKPSKYSVKKDNDGNIILNHATIADANIRFLNDGTIEYYHPKIIIDGDTYILKVSKTSDTKVGSNINNTSDNEGSSEKLPENVDDWDEKDWEKFLSQFEDEGEPEVVDKDLWKKTNNLEEIREYCRKKLYFTYASAAADEIYRQPIDVETADDVIDLLQYGVMKGDQNCIFMLACVHAGNKPFRALDEDYNDVPVETPKDYTYANDVLAKGLFRRFLRNVNWEKDDLPFNLKKDQVMYLINNAYPDL